MDLLAGLTKSQKEAVCHGEGPVLVVAGAGTGKTTVIARRIAWLIMEKGVKPEEILALTFTDKAAVEMEERVDTLVPYGFVDAWISTFHAFCDRILRDHAIELDLPVDFRVLTEPEELMFLGEHLFELPLNKLRPNNNPQRYLKDLLKFFSKIKDEDISAEDYMVFAQDWQKKAVDKEEQEQAEIHLEIGRAFKKVSELMQKNGYVDFGDQMALVVRLFRENPRILKQYQQKFKYVLVDEFQDTNYIQNELLKLLAPQKSNLMVVGDDDQSIYRFRGAAISNILSFITTWEKAKQIVLTENFRSAKEVLDSSYRLITQNNPNRLEVTNNIVKKLKASGENAKLKGVVRYDLSQTFSAEADLIAKKIKEEVESGRNYKDIAILLRKNTDAKAFEQALVAKNIPYKFSGNAGLYVRPEIVNLISFIAALCNSEDSLSLFHLSTGEIYNLSPTVALKINVASRKLCQPVEEVYTCYLKGTLELDIDENESKKIERLHNDLELYRGLMTELTAGQLIYRFLTETGILKELLREVNKDAAAETKIQNIAQFFEKLKAFESVSEDKSLLNFYQNLALLREAGENPGTAEIDPDLDAVNIITVHKSKGLEFDVVFMANLTNGNFPQRRHHETFEIPKELIKERLTEGDYHLEEERRLFYVGMTRARQRLFLSSAEDHGGKQRKKVSQFVVETVGEVGEFKQKHKLEVLEKLKVFSYEKDLEELIKGFYEEGKTLVLTPHQIDDYLSCPLKFKYAHIFKLPLIRKHTVMYGSAIHAAVQYYYEAKKRGKVVELSELYASFERSWIPEGFYSKKHEEERFLEGKNTLKGFFEREESSGELPDKVEEPFSFVIGGGEKRVKINGRYDAVFVRTDGPEIRDFKTSDVVEQKAADKRAKENRQISVYALSWLETTGEIPANVSLSFVGSGLVGAVTKTEKELEKTKGEIEAVAEGIRAMNFGASPGWGECDRCAYKGICPFKK